MCRTFSCSIGASALSRSSMGCFWNSAGKCRARMARYCGISSQFGVIVIARPGGARDGSHESISPLRTPCLSRAIALGEINRRDVAFPPLAKIAANVSLRLIT